MIYDVKPQVHKEPHVLQAEPGTVEEREPEGHLYHFPSEGGLLSAVLVDLVLLRGDAAKAETLHNRQQRVYVPDRNHRIHGRVCIVIIGAVP